MQQTSSNTTQSHSVTQAVAAKNSAKAAAKNSAQSAAATPLGNQFCPRKLKLLSDFWTLRIIGTLATQSQRFCEIQRATDNMNPVTLTRRLKKAQSDGFITRTSFANGEVVYELTATGQKVLPVIAAIDAFSAD